VQQTDLTQAIGYAREEAGWYRHVKQIVSVGSAQGIDLAEALAQVLVVRALEHVDFHIVKTLYQTIPDRLIECAPDMLLNVLVHQYAKGIVVDIEAIQAQNGEAVG
jgi:hypothetical protein